MPLPRLQLEILEPRHALTGLPTVSLDAGVLAITGASDADIITLDYDATQVTVVELSQSFSLRDIATIDIATGDGDDAVQLHYTGPKNPKWIGVALLVHAGGGNDELIDALGKSYFLGGLEVLTISRKGDTRLNGQKLTWFDTNVDDTVLRSVVKGQYVDKLLSRNDMLTLFHVTAEDGLITPDEFASLQAIVGNKPLFRKLDDVFTISNYVVNGTQSNNTDPVLSTSTSFTPGVSGLQLEQLVDRWFLGKAHPDAHDLDTGEEYEYRETAGTLFVDGPSYTDIRQGNLGDCYLLGGLAAVAVHSPKPIVSMFIVNGDGTYTVRFYNGATPYYIVVDSQLPVSQSDQLVFASAGNRYDDPQNELWVALAEKAYAQLAELGWLDTGGGAMNSYAAINAGWPGDATGQITGKTVIDLLVLDNPAVIVKAFSLDRAITLITPSDPASSDIISNHVYVMIGYEARTREFSLFNPWGLDNGSVPGIVTFTWDQMLQNFHSWDYGPKV